MNYTAQCSPPAPGLRTSPQMVPRVPREANFRPRWRKPMQRITYMLKSVKSRAEEQFAATQKESLKAVKQKEKAQLERVEKVAKLRALRLAVEAAEKEVAVKAEAAKAAKAAKKTKKA